MGARRDCYPLVAHLQMFLSFGPIRSGCRGLDISSGDVSS